MLLADIFLVKVRIDSTYKASSTFLKQFSEDISTMGGILTTLINISSRMRFT